MSEANTKELHEYMQQHLHVHHGTIQDHPDLLELVVTAQVWAFQRPWDSKRVGTFDEWSGPWKILRPVGANFYELLPHHSWQNTQRRIVHVNDLKLFQPPNHLQAVNQPPESHFHPSRLVFLRLNNHPQLPSQIEGGFSWEQENA
jgi:hypothetical protein